MLGHAIESNDYNLPVDAVTRKPLFAFSCNRRVRETYDGPLLLADDNSPIYPADFFLKQGSGIKGIFDQKSRDGHVQHDATAHGSITFEVGPYNYLEFDGSSYFTLPISQYLTHDVGVFVVCDPDNSKGRAPIFSGTSPTHELCFDVGSAYMRFDYYELTKKQSLFGGIDSPENKLDGYAGGFADDILIESTSGSIGESVRSTSLSNIDASYIGRSTSDYYKGKLYELLIFDFKVSKTAQAGTR